MKTISFAVPCYNSAAYMNHCIDTLLTGGEDIEIILVNDGSSDETAAIADDYAARYPNIVRAIHQENGGHGEGVNQGLRHATGVYYKVVDSDDWVDEQALAQVLDKLRMFIRRDKPLDLMIANYVYEHVEDGTSKVMGYGNVFPQDKVFTWEQIGSFRPSQYLLMHSVIYRTQMLRESGVTLPKHTFYVDNIFVYQPLPYVKTMYYMNVDLYRYFIGRADQSVNESVMIRRIDQQLTVTRLMMRQHDLFALKEQTPKLGGYMMNYFSMMMSICSVFLLLDGSEEALKKRDELWNDLLVYDKRLYRKMRHASLSAATVLPGRFGRRMSKNLYHIARKIFKFN